MLSPAVEIDVHKSFENSSWTGVWYGILCTPSYHTRHTHDDARLYLQEEAIKFCSKVCVIFRSYISYAKFPSCRERTPAVNFAWGICAYIQTRGRSKRAQTETNTTNYKCAPVQMPQMPQVRRRVRRRRRRHQHPQQQRQPQPSGRPRRWPPRRQPAIKQA